MDKDRKELKNKLHESIENVDDETVLKAVKEVLDRKYLPEEKIDVSYKQQQRIEKAKESIEKGEYLTNEQADQIIDEWLNK